MAQVAIITASDSGIGKECALLLAQQGFDIGITWHSDEEGAKDTAREVVSHGTCGDCAAGSGNRQKVHRRWRNSFNGWGVLMCW